MATKKLIIKIVVLIILFSFIKYWFHEKDAGFHYQTNQIEDFEFSGFKGDLSLRTNMIIFQNSSIVTNKTAIDMVLEGERYSLNPGELFLNYTNSEGGTFGGNITLNVSDSIIDSLKYKESAHLDYDGFSKSHGVEIDISNDTSVIIPDKTDVHIAGTNFKIKMNEKEIKRNITTTYSYIRFENVKNPGGLIEFTVSGQHSIMPVETLSLIGETESFVAKGDKASTFTMIQEKMNEERPIVLPLKGEGVNSNSIKVYGNVESKTKKITLTGNVRELRISGKNQLNSWWKADLLEYTSLIFATILTFLLEKFLNRIFKQRNASTD